MVHLNATDQSAAVDSQQFTLSTVSAMNLLAQLEWKAIQLAILASILVTLVDGHGRLFDPPSRSTAWRVGFDTPKDYNDMEGFCGGFDRQWLVNEGRCGVCGDPYDEMVKPHEAPGGLYATGTIVRNYTQGEIIPITIQITATHRGYYEFRLCPNNNPKKDPIQNCFERHPLDFVDATGATTSIFSLENLAPATYQVRLQLPPDITCSQCIIQWTYVTGNRWGICSDGTSRLGCGPQESFRACSDVAISPKEGISTATQVQTMAPSSTTTVRPFPMFSPTTTISPITTQAITTSMAPVSTIAAVTQTTISPTTTTTRRPVRPVRPTRPGRPRPTRPTTRPTLIPEIVPPTTNKPPTLLPLPGLGLLTRPPIQPVTRPTLPPTTRPLVIQSASTTPTPDNNGKCSNYIPVTSQNMPGMSEWCNNNCRLGYCPSDYCKCAQ